MTTRASRVVAVTAAVLLGAGSLGCGVISQAKQTLDNVSEIADMADKLEKSADLTYTAEYALAGGGTATAVQQPPNAAFIGAEGRYILTSDMILLCNGATNRWTCQRSVVQAGGAPPGDQSAYMQAIAAGGGFASTPMALALMTAASVVPGVKVEKSEKKLAGLDTTCLKASGIPADEQANSVTMEEFFICVADNGVLAEMKGTGTDGSSYNITLSKFSSTVDAKHFLPPAGAKIVDVGQIQPTK